MKLKSIICVMAMCGFIFLANHAQANEIHNNNPYFATDSRHDYLYANPPKQKLNVYGKYIMLSRKIRYVHSPSKLKGARHAARINAYNLQAYGY